MTITALISWKVRNFAFFQPNFGNLAHFSYCWPQKLSLAVWLNFADHNLGHFSLQGNIKDIEFSSELHNIVCENNGMQVSIAWNNNRTIGGTTIGHCFERFGFIWPFSEP